MKNRLALLLTVCGEHVRDGAYDADAIALRLGLTPAEVLRDLLDLGKAGALPAPTSPVPKGEPSA